MKAAEIRKLSDKEIEIVLGEQSLALTRLKLSHAVTPSVNPMEIRKGRKVIARLLTEQTARKSVSNN